MNRYWLFVGQEPILGGMWEFYDSYYFCDHAIDAAKQMTWPTMKHVLELDTMEIVWSDPPKHAEDLNHELQRKGF